MAILDDLKISLRIGTSTFDGEITDLISAAKADLKLSGVIASKILDADPLIKRAITVYVKANFGLMNDNSEKFQMSYDMLKSHLSLSVDYNTEAVT